MCNFRNGIRNAAYLWKLCIDLCLSDHRCLFGAGIDGVLLHLRCPCWSIGPGKGVLTRTD